MMSVDAMEEKKASASVDLELDATFRCLQSIVPIFGYFGHDLIAMWGQCCKRCTALLATKTGL
jgi:hypothetical protein